jgi:hypothetical protein
MKTLAIIALSLLLPVGFANAATDYFLKIDGVEGESAAPAETETLYGIVGQAFVLDATKSQDDGTISRFAWKQVSGPTVRLSGTTGAATSFTPTQAGTYVFDLVVTDATGLSSVVRKSKVVVGAAPSAGTVTAPTPPPQEASVDYLIKIPPIDGETEKGNVEMEWKVEEGTKAAVPGIEPDDIDVAVDPEPITPDFSILLGGGDSEAERSTRSKIAEILLSGAKEEGAPVEQVSLNFEKITTTTRKPVKLLGFIPMTVSATVEVDAKGEVKVRFPWWAFLTAGKDEKRLGEETLETLRSVLAKNQAVVDGLLMIRY